MLTTGSSPVRPKLWGVAWYRELTRRLHYVGTSVPSFLDQVQAFLTTAAFGDTQEQLALETVRDLCVELRAGVTGKTHQTLSAGQRVWVPGHSPVSGGAGQFERQIEVLTAMRVPPPAIALHFHVPSYTRRGQDFDMESLGYVALAAWRHNLACPVPVKLGDLYRPSSVWLTMTSMSDSGQGVEIAYEDPPKLLAEAVAVDLVIAKPPTLSVRGTIIPELEGQSELSEPRWLGLELTFSSEVDIAEFGFYGPIKPLIDAMSPVLGRDRRSSPADHRLHDLRIRGDGRSDGGVRARFWYCNE